MATRNSKVILAKNIRLDRDYQNTTDYSEANLLLALQSQTHFVASKTDCSFIREENAIYLEIPFGTALQANYLAFQNNDYSGKWFFAFIDSVEYISDSNTKINITIDHLSTWFEYWTPKACFVTREHANTDVAGDNLIPESFELGEYVVNGTITELTGASSSATPLIGMITTRTPDSTTTVYNTSQICGIPTAGALVVFTSIDSLIIFLDSMSNLGYLENISMVFLINAGTISLTDCTKVDQTPSLPDTNPYYRFNGKDLPYSHTNTLARPTTLNGFTPVNQKMLTYPFMGLVISNNTGSSNVLCYEYFANPASCVMQFQGVPSIGGSIIEYPLNYKGRADNTLEGVQGTKLPTLSWSGDAYTNWLTQNAINRASGNIGIAGQAGNAFLGAVTAGATSGGLGAILSGVSGVAGVAQSIMGVASERQQHQFVPYSVNGSVNNGDIITSSRMYGIYAIPTSIQYQFAERIDKYFTRFGYATNKIKVPNQTGRQNWNYVEIASGEAIGYSTGSISVPTESMMIINKAYQKGITIFHNIDNIGEFSLSNGIISS